MRYVLMPDYLISRTDGQNHYISAPELAMLYGLDLYRHDVVIGTRPSYRPRDGDVILRPRYDGNYKLPEKPDGQH